MKTMKRLSMVLLTLVLCACLLTPAFAAGFTYPAYTAAETDNVQFTKYLVMKSDANVPNATFSYAVAPGGAIAATDSTLAVIAGPTATVGGNVKPAVADVTFSPSDATTDGTPTDASAAGKKYATKTAVVDFVGVKFPEPGVYRYIITESGTNQGVTNDAEATRTLDVYVNDNGGALEIAGSVMYKGTVTAAPKPLATDAGHTPNGAEPDGVEKLNSYTNEYATQNLSFGKEVTGNQGSKDKYFDFTVTITGAVPGTKYTVDLSDAEAKSGVNAATIAANQNKDNLAELTVGADGTLTAHYYLQHNQYVTIKGLAKDTHYSVTENKEDYSSSSGTSKIAVASHGSVGDPDYVPAKLYADSTSGTIADADIYTGYTNTRVGTVPTGVALTILPGVMIVVCAVAGILLIGKKKRKG